MAAFVAASQAVQALVAAERAGAEALGTWVADPATPASSKVLMARLVRHAAWRADQWAALVPTPADLAVEGLGAFAGPVGALAGASDPVAAWRAVVVRFAAAADELAVADPVGQAALRRVALRVQGDLEADLALLDAHLTQV